MGVRLSKQRRSCSQMLYPVELRAARKEEPLICGGTAERQPVLR